MRKKNKKYPSKKRLECRKQRLAMAGNRCEICGKPIDITCSMYHLLPAGEPKRNAVENVMVLCGACHRELEKRTHYHGIKHLEDDTCYDDSEPLPEQTEGCYEPE